MSRIRVNDFSKWVDHFGLSEALKNDGEGVHGLGYGQTFMEGHVFDVLPGQEFSYVFCNTSTDAGNKTLKNTVAGLNMSTMGSSIRFDHEDDEKWHGFCANRFGFLIHTKKDDNKFYVRVYRPDETGILQVINDVPIANIDLDNDVVLGCYADRQFLHILSRKNFGEVAEQVNDTSLLIDNLHHVAATSVIPGVSSEGIREIKVHDSFTETFFYFVYEDKIKSRSAIESRPVKTVFEGSTKNMVLMPHVYARLGFNDRTKKIVYALTSPEGKFELKTLIVT